MTDINKHFFATYPLVSARWHLEGKRVGDNHVLIRRIWRDDHLPDYTLAWRIGENGNRTITSVIVGEPAGHPELHKPADGSLKLLVTNPAHFSSYNKDEDI